MAPGQRFRVSSQPRYLAFDNANRRLYAATRRQSPRLGIYGFDVSSRRRQRPAARLPLNPLAAIGEHRHRRQPTLPAATAATSTFAQLRGRQQSKAFDSNGAPFGGPYFPLDPAANPDGSIGSPFRGCGVAVDSSGGLWVTRHITASVRAPARPILRYNAGGAFQSSVDITAEYALNQRAPATSTSTPRATSTSLVRSAVASSGASPAPAATPPRRDSAPPLTRELTPARSRRRRRRRRHRLRRKRGRQRSMS